MTRIFLLASLVVLIGVGVIALLMVFSPSRYERLWRSQFRALAPPDWVDRGTPGRKWETRIGGLILLGGVLFFIWLVWNVFIGEAVTKGEVRIAEGSSSPSSVGLFMSFILGGGLVALGMYSVTNPGNASTRLSRWLLKGKEPTKAPSSRHLWWMRLVGIILLLSGLGALVRLLP
jgi:hypothetical protein